MPNSQRLLATVIVPVYNGAKTLDACLSALAAQTVDPSSYEVIVVGPRQAFAQAERFEAATLVHDWPDAALRALAPDPRTAIAVLAHDPKLDEPALDAALRSEAFFATAAMVGGSGLLDQALLAREYRDVFRVPGLLGVVIPLVAAVARLLGRRLPEPR